MTAFLNGTDPGLRQTRTPTRQILTNGSGFTANSSTTITLTNDCGTEDHLEISFDGIVQHHSTYTYSSAGNTVTFNAVIPAGVAEIEASFVVTVSSITVPDGSVSTSKIVDSNVTTSKILDANITESKLAALSVSTAKLQDNSVSLSKLAGGTADKFLGFDSSGNPAEKSVVIPATAVKIVEMTASVDGTNASQYSPQPFRFNTFVFGSASDFNTTTHKFLPTGGIYHCYFSGLMSVGGTGFMHVRIDVNTLRDGYVEKASGHTTDLFQHSAIMAFASGEEVWWTAYGSSGSTNKPLASKAHLIIHKLG